MKRIAAVVVTYNRKELLLECIECLKRQDLELLEPISRAENIDGKLEPYVSLDLLVIDNASTDGTEEALVHLVSQENIQYFNTGANLGGAGGFNFGMRKALELGYDYVWVMDDDCLPESSALRELLKVDKKLEGNYGYLSSVVRWVDGSPCKMNIQRHPLTKNIADFTPELQPITLASFVSLFVPTPIIAEVGLPIKDFFIWTDDWEFTRRISRKYPCYLVGKSIVIHASKNNGAGNIITDTPDRLDRYRMVYRNDMVLYREEGFRGYFYVISRALYHLIQVLLKSDGAKLKKCGIIILSNIAGLRFHPEVEYVSPQEPNA